jgi:hypothetical protein
LTGSIKGGIINKVTTPTPVALQPAAQYDFRWFDLNRVTWDVARCNGCYPQEGGIDIVEPITLPITLLERGVVIGAGWYPNVGYILSLDTIIPGYGHADTYYMEYQRPLTFSVGQVLEKGTIIAWGTFLEIGINPPWCVAPWNSCSRAWVRNPRYLLTQEMEKGL